MKFILQEGVNKHLIVLVHGLNGSEVSWRGNPQRFVENLVANQMINENFDLALFTYDTKIFEIRWLKKIRNTIAGFFFSKPKGYRTGFNVGIDSISRLLKTEISGIAESYDTISFIAHSMGGLVVKSALTWLENVELEKTELIISLSVPHMGSSLGNIGSGLLGNNPQIANLKLMSTFTNTLNLRFAQLRPQPRIIYQFGNQDIVVNEQSAIPPGVVGQCRQYTADNHFSVLLIDNPLNHALFSCIISELNKILQPFSAINISIPNGANFQFVINLIASKSNVQVDLSCFAYFELQAPLRNHNLRGSKIEDVFERIGKLAISIFPHYTVKFDKVSSSYIFNK